jgi:ABC-2 type transport system permease protein
MSNVVTIMKRELGAYLLSPIAYVVIAVFLFTSGLAFGLGTFGDGNEASLRALCEFWMILILVFVLPMITMRLFSDELRAGTIETLMTLPVTETEVVLGKFLGALAFFLVLLGTTMLYPILIGAYGPLDGLLLISNLIGLALLGGLYIAFGLFFSACTKHQVIAVLLTSAVLALMTFASFALAQQVEGRLKALLLQISIRSHYVDFVRGLFTLEHAVFFLSMIGLLLFVTVKRLEMRRWQ